MRRAVAILALLATAWPHAVVLECALGSAWSPADHGDQAEHAAAQHGPPHGSGHGAAHPGLHGAHHAAAAGAVADAPDGDDGAPAGNASCAMVMACGLVMIQTAGGGSPGSDASSPDPGVTRSASAPSTTDLASDTPPPRRHA